VFRSGANACSVVLQYHCFYNVADCKTRMEIGDMKPSPMLCKMFSIVLARWFSFP